MTILLVIFVSERLERRAIKKPSEYGEPYPFVLKNLVVSSGHLQR